MTSTRLGWLASGATIAFAITLRLMADRPGDLPGPPDTGARTAMVYLLLATPGVVGLVGVIGRRRVLHVAAGLLCMLQAVIAFSGVTLVFLVPALLFLRAGLGGRTAPDRRAIDARRLVALSAVAVPVALLIVAWAGVIGVLVLTAIGSVGAVVSGGHLPARPVRPIRRSDAIAAAAIVALVVGAWVSLFTLTEEVCWIASPAPDGSLTYRRIPVTNTISLRSTEVAGGCDSGVPTIEGLGISAVLAIGAVGVGFLASPDAPGRTAAATYHRRDDDPPKPDRPGRQRGTGEPRGDDGARRRPAGADDRADGGRGRG